MNLSLPCRGNEKGRGVVEHVVLFLWMVFLCWFHWESDMERGGHGWLALEAFEGFVLPVRWYNATTQAVVSFTIIKAIRL